ncbi:hypothetical protein G6F63_015856 [Rhizopus arrhizus]|nr:hypothetical protein G6F63_015856 [Rhizopus arrhizus]
MGCAERPDRPRSAGAQQSSGSHRLIAAPDHPVHHGGRRACWRAAPAAAGAEQCGADRGQSGHLVHPHQSRQ